MGDAARTELPPQPPRDPLEQPRAICNQFRQIVGADLDPTLTPAEAIRRYNAAQETTGRREIYNENNTANIDAVRTAQQYVRDITAFGLTTETELTDVRAAMIQAVTTAELQLGDAPTLTQIAEGVRTLRTAAGNAGILRANNRPLEQLRDALRTDATILGIADAATFSPRNLATRIGNFRQRVTTAGIEINARTTNQDLATRIRDSGRIVGIRDATVSLDEIVTGIIGAKTAGDAIGFPNAHTADLQEVVDALDGFRTDAVEAFIPDAQDSEVRDLNAAIREEARIAGIVDYEHQTARQVLDEILRIREQVTIAHIPGADRAEMEQLATNIREQAHIVSGQPVPADAALLDLAHQIGEVRHQAAAIRIEGAAADPLDTVVVRIRRDGALIGVDNAAAADLAVILEEISQVRRDAQTAGIANAERSPLTEIYDQLVRIRSNAIAAGIPQADTMPMGALIRRLQTDGSIAGIDQAAIAPTAEVARQLAAFRQGVRDAHIQIADGASIQEMVNQIRTEAGLLVNPEDARNANPQDLVHHIDSFRRLAQTAGIADARTEGVQTVIDRIRADGRLIEAGLNEAIIDVIDGIRDVRANATDIGLPNAGNAPLAEIIAGITTFRTNAAAGIPNARDLSTSELIQAIRTSGDILHIDPSIPIPEILTRITAVRKDGAIIDPASANMPDLQDVVDVIAAIRGYATRIGIQAADTATMAELATRIKADGRIVGVDANAPLYDVLTEIAVTRARGEIIGMPNADNAPLQEIVTAMATFRNTARELSVANAANIPIEDIISELIRLAEAENIPDANNMPIPILTEQLQGRRVTAELIREVGGNNVEVTIAKISSDEIPTYTIEHNLVLVAGGTLEHQGRQIRINGLLPDEQNSIQGAVDIIGDMDQLEAQLSPIQNQYNAFLRRNNINQVGINRLNALVRIRNFLAAPTNIGVLKRELETLNWKVADVNALRRQFVQAGPQFNQYVRFREGYDDAAGHHEGLNELEAQRTQLRQNYQEIRGQAYEAVDREALETQRQTITNLRAYLARFNAGNIRNLAELIRSGRITSDEAAPLELRNAFKMISGEIKTHKATLPLERINPHQRYLIRAARMLAGIPDIRRENNIVRGEIR